MKLKTLIYLVLLLLQFSLCDCSIIASLKTADTVEEATKQRNLLKRKRAREARRKQKKIIKEYWAKQTPQVRKTVKRNAKKQRKLVKQREKIQKENEKRRRRNALNEAK